MTAAVGTPIAWELADWALSVRPADLPDDVLRAAARHLLDGLGCAVAAARTGAAAPAVRVARELGGGRPEAAVIGVAGERLSRPAAAFANGVLVHALDFDDTHAGGLVHATAPVLPVVLAAGAPVGNAGRAAPADRIEASGSGGPAVPIARVGSAPSGAEALTAMAVGLEIVCRLGAAAPHGFHDRGLHATAICGVFAAALVAARLSGLSPDQAVHALGIAGSRAGGLLEFLNSDATTKQLHPGFAAHDGMVAAALAAEGMTGPATVFEGDYGIYRALAGRTPDRDAVTGGLGTRWEAARITIKPYPACQLMHASLDAARLLAARLRAASGTCDAVSQVESVRVRVHPDTAAIVCGVGRDAPGSAYAAKFSLPWSVAAMLVDGEVTARTYQRLDRPEVVALAARVGHETVHFGGVAADQPGWIRAELRDGKAITTEIPRSRGGPDDRELDATVRAKALGNLAGRHPERVADLALALAGLPSLHPLLQALEDHVR